MWQLMILLLSKCHYNIKKQLFAFLTIKTDKKCNSQFRGSLRNVWWVLVWQQALEASPALCAVRLWPNPHTEVPWGFLLPPFIKVQLKCLVWPLWTGGRRAQGPQEPQVPHLAGEGQLSSSLPWLSPELGPASIHPCRKVALAFLSDKNSLWEQQVVEFSLLIVDFFCLVLVLDPNAEILNLLSTLHKLIFLFVAVW